MKTLENFMCCLYHYVFMLLQLYLHTYSWGVTGVALWKNIDNQIGYVLSQTNYSNSIDEQNNQNEAKSWNQAGNPPK